MLRMARGSRGASGEGIWGAASPRPTPTADSWGDGDGWGGSWGAAGSGLLRSRIVTGGGDVELLIVQIWRCLDAIALAARSCLSQKSAVS